MNLYMEHLTQSRTVGMGLSRLAQPRPGTQSSSLLPLAQTAWFPSPGAPGAAFSMKCQLSPPGVFSGVIPWMHGGIQMGLSRMPFTSRDQASTKNPCVPAEKLSGNVLMLRRVNSLEPWRYRHSLCSSERWNHVRGGRFAKALCMSLKP